MLKDNIINLYRKISLLDSLKPCQKVNTLFQELCFLVTKNYSSSLVENILNDSDIKSIIFDLHKLCAEGEYLLELHWSEKIALSSCPKEFLKKFPYSENYYSLCRLEYHAMVASLGSKPEKILFLGAGPLPLSVIIYSSFYNLSCTLLDKSEEACSYAEVILSKLDVRVDNIICSDSEFYKSYDNYDVIIFAALNGINKKEKLNIACNVSENSSQDTLLLFRSSYDLRRLLYPEVNLDKLRFINKSLEINPFNHIINSIIIASRNSQL
ncbi:nicotianamine synthase family protein [Kistimonas asteriae]|uniref:nicotianamine synthase family protein n=1 Tax=Kistimonas asteriae TaxID=517724 RepID=UPI001BADC769|nr:nicotianamine synthase family protein [Kistimonas asteriae]